MTDKLIDDIIADLGIIEPVLEPLTEHEKKIAGLIGTLEGIGGFPDAPRKLRYLVEAYAEFASTEPYKSKTVPDSPKNGKIPAVLLINYIRRSCEFMPAPIVAREMYEKLGFKPLDGIWSYELPQVCRRRDPAVRDE